MTRIWSPNWHVEIEFDEDETHTHATVRAQLGDGETMTALGDAYRNPKDASQPMIGEEIAAARALIALGTELLQPRRRAIEQATHHPVHLPADGVALAVCLLFDRRSERAVRALWDRLEQQGVPSLRSHTHGRHVPHVSYAVLRSWDQAAVSAALVELGGGAPVELQLRRRRTVPPRPDLAGRRCGCRLRGTPAAGRRRRHAPPAPSCTSTTCPEPGCRTARLRRARRWHSCPSSWPRCSTCCRCGHGWTVPRWSTVRPARSARCRAAVTALGRRLHGASAFICSKRSV